MLQISDMLLELDPFRFIKKQSASINATGYKIEQNFALFDPSPLLFYFGFRVILFFLV